MLTRFLNIILWVVSFVSIVTMLGVVTFLVMVVQQPRSLSSVTPYLEKQLNNLSTHYKIRIDDSFIEWNSAQQTFSVSTKNLRLLNDTKEIIASFPNVLFDFSVVKFIRGDLFSPDITLVNPSLYVDLSKRALYVTPDSDTKAQTTLFTELGKQLREGKNTFPVSSLRVKDARLFINNGASEFVWKISDGYGRIDYTKKNQIVTNFDVDFGEDVTYFESRMFYNKNDSVDINVTFQNFPSYVSYDMFPKLQVLRNVNITLDGSVDFLLSKEWEVPQVQFDINKAYGEFHLPKYFKSSTQIKDLQAHGSLYQNFTVLTVNDLTVDLGGPTFSAMGTFKNSGSFQNIQPEIDADLTLTDLEVNTLDNYWPIGLGQKAREWIITNIKGGMVKSADASVTIAPEGDGKLAHKKINATVNVENTSVSYQPNFPEVKNVFASVDFTDKSMTANISSARIHSSTVKKATVKINDFTQMPMLLDIEGSFKGKNEDLVHFLKASMHDKTVHPMVKSLYNIVGNAVGDVSLSIPLVNDFVYEDMSLNISANLTETSIPNILNGNDIVNSSVLLLVDNEKVKVAGDMEINGALLGIDLQHNMLHSDGFITKYKIDGKLSSYDLKSIGIADIPHVENKFGVNINVKEKQDIRLITGDIDITDAQIFLPELSFTKVAGVSGKVKFGATQNLLGKTIDITSFLASGEGFSTSGQMVINVAENSIASLMLNDTIFANNVFKAKYKKSRNYVTLDITGKSLDLSNANFGTIFKKDENERQGFSINADIKTLHMKNGVAIQEFTANASCKPDRCDAVNVYGEFKENKYVVMDIKPAGVRSDLKVKSDDAGLLFNALGVSQHIKGGRIVVEASVANGKNNKKFADGIMRIRDFTAIKTPLLGKLLTLASLKGIGDLLNNQGIPFKKFEAPFDMSDGVITIKDAKSSGASVGITSSGTIDMNSGIVDLKGAVVPAYAVNKVLGKIPLVGPLLVGKKNEGLIATNYKVKGPYEDVKMSVNPLTILTPGFLRQIFDILPGE